MTDDAHTYPEGVPCWIDLTQPDADAAVRFYGDLLGWTATDVMPAEAPGAYFVTAVDGQDAAAIAPGDDDRGWLSYIACDDIEATAARVTAAGGRVLEPPLEVGPAGHSATCADPQGAVFRLWQAGRRLGAQAVNVPGAWNFSDLHTPDAEASLRFYGDVFGWRVDDDLGAGMIRLPGYGDFLASTVDPEIHERQKFAPPGFADVICGLTPDDTAAWWIRFTVADRDATARRAVELGGTVESTTETEWTREAVVVDPGGARFVVSQLVIPDDLRNLPQDEVWQN